MIIKKTVGIMLAAALAGFVGVGGYALFLLKKRPPLTLYESRRAQPDFVPLEKIPEKQILLILRQEDRVFYEHPGYNMELIRRAWKTNLQEKRIVRGGSTITQQLAKNLYLRFTKTFLRKATELLIALTLERELGKDRILELYVNIIYFGNGVYGISDAAGFYFGKDVKALSLNQMIMLSLLPQAPTAGNPIQHPEVFERLRNRNLSLLRQYEPQLITAEEEADILSHDAAHLDPELRKQDDFTRSYPQTVPMINERFGPLSGRADTGRRRPETGFPEDTK